MKIHHVKRALEQYKSANNNNNATGGVNKRKKRKRRIPKRTITVDPLRYECIIKGTTITEPPNEIVKKLRLSDMWVFRHRSHGDCAATDAVDAYIGVFKVSIKGWVYGENQYYNPTVIQLKHIYEKERPLEKFPLGNIVNKDTGEPYWVDRWRQRVDMDRKKHHRYNGNKDNQNP